MAAVSIQASDKEGGNAVGAIQTDLRSSAVWFAQALRYILSTKGDSTRLAGALRSACTQTCSANPMQMCR